MNDHLIRNVIAFVVLISASHAYSALRDFETTRLKSTAGAGVGAILMDEASILNPAPIAFFDIGAIYFQKTGKNITQEDDRPIAESDQTAFIISDSKGRVGGSISYLKYNDNFDQRQRLSASVSTPFGSRSAIGFTYRKTEDRLSNNGVDYTEDNYNQSIIGVSHAVSENFTMGLVVIDPLKERPQDTKAIIGTQLTYKGFIQFMLDAGGDYTQNISDSLLYKSALQFKILDDVFLRFGTYRDKAKRERGNGIGLGWVQPKLIFDVAIKNSKNDFFPEINQIGQEIRESSFSVSYKF